MATRTGDAERKTSVRRSQTTLTYDAVNRVISKQDNDAGSKRGAVIGVVVSA